MDLVLRTVVVLVLVLLLTRAVGRRELSSMGPFDVIMLVVVGDLVQNAVTQSDMSVTGAVIVISTMALFVVAVSWLHLRVPPVRGLLEDRPTVLVEDGRVLERNLRRERLTLDDVLEEARLAQVATLADIRWAVLESGGQISIIPRAGGG